MKINNVNSNYTPTFKADTKQIIAYTPVAYPELTGYNQSVKNARRADAFTSNPVSAFYNKIKNLFDGLFTPEVEKTTTEIKAGIDKMVQDPAVRAKLNIVA